MRRRLGFTLVELLVVVAIIALLIAILLPALGRVRHVTRTAVCLSNHKQIGLGLVAYTNDSRGSWPIRGGANGEIYPPAAWGEPDEGWDMHETIERYIPARDVYVCPQSEAYNGRGPIEAFWPIAFNGVFKWPEYSVWAGFQSSNYTFYDADGNQVAQDAAISMGISDDRFIAPAMTCRLDIFTPDHPAVGTDFHLTGAHAPRQFLKQMPDDATIQQQELNALWPDGSAATYSEGIFAGNRQDGNRTIRHWVER